MGITSLTLALASLRGDKIPDHKSGEMVQVKVAGYTDKHPDYVLIYDNGEIREVKWTGGQAIAGEIIEVCHI